MQQKEKVSPTDLRRKVILLAAKVVIVLLGLYILLFRIFGIIRIDSNAMFPRISGGDMVAIIHGGDYTNGDAIVYKNLDRTYAGRVIAKAGDVVNYVDGKITVNGSIEDVVSYGDTVMPSEGGFAFPYTVTDNCYFILGDNRNDLDDSRTFGLIKVTEIEGKIIGVFRSHGI